MTVSGFSLTVFFRRRYLCVSSQFDMQPIPKYCRAFFYKNYLFWSNFILKILYFASRWYIMLEFWVSFFTHGVVEKELKFFHDHRDLGVWLLKSLEIEEFKTFFVELNFHRKKFDGLLLTFHWNNLEIFCLIYDIEITGMFFTDSFDVFL